ncbi:helix-turn-helix domain-containing protein [Vineibacter terrae]|uniref:helix-turn-helix domain-containing protein n=1 Tax=Vineibacter terrae TaxID=2586908 RepID=UPI0039C93E4B
MHPLAEWLQAEKITAAEFARRIRVSRAALSRLLACRRPPSITLVDQIELETRGAITPNHLFGAYRKARGGWPLPPASASNHADGSGQGLADPAVTFPVAGGPA